MVQCPIHRNRKVDIHHQGPYESHLWAPTLNLGLLLYEEFYIHYTKLSFTYSRKHTFYFVCLAQGTPSFFTSLDLWAPVDPSQWTWLDLQLPMQQVPIITNGVSLWRGVPDTTLFDKVCGRSVGGFFRGLRFPLPVKPTTTIEPKYC